MRWQCPVCLQGVLPDEDLRIVKHRNSLGVRCKEGTGEPIRIARAHHDVA